MTDPTAARIEALEKRVSTLSRSIRIAIGTLVCVYAIRCVSVLLNVPRYREIFSDLFGGKALPAVTQFFLAYYAPICVSILLLCAIAIITLLYFPDHPWGLSSVIVITVLCIAITELAAWALRQPLINIIQSLGGA